MSEIVGPYRIIQTPEGFSTPWYIIPFDKSGRCKAPQTRAHLLSAIANGSFSHVFIFSHGWNNDWKAASERYAGFVEGFSKMRAEQGLNMPAGYAPLLIGVFWPSTSLVLPWERGPGFAGAEDSGKPEDQDIFAAADYEALSDIAASLADDALTRFYELANQSELDEKQALELAQLLQPLLADDDEMPGQVGIAAEDLLSTWLDGSPESSTDTGAGDGTSDDFGTATPVSGGPASAGLFSALDPRHAIRMTTVWRMKDRAGTVGASGLGPLLREALEVSSASFHLVGHSYGGKVVLSSIAIGELPRPVDSLLLLQPAVSGRCFAENADGEGNPGGYRPVLGRVKQPILTTYSRHDFPLTKTFHLAVRRKSDLGEQRIAGGPPSRFAALGGYGPAKLGSECKDVPIKSPGSAYDELEDPALEVLALNGDDAISGHGDISNPETWWALYEQMRRS